MARKKEIPQDASQDVESKPKKRIRKKKEIVPPSCWEVCSKLIVKDGTDYVHICLGDVFVTHTELTRMLDGGTNQKETV